MSETVLNAKTREGSGKGVVRKLRVEGKIPAIVYGPNLKPINLSIDSKELDDLSRSVSIESTIIILQIEGGPKKPINTLVREVQRHPYKDQIYHLDFMQISMKEAVDVEVPIILLGIPDGVRTTGGILQHQMREVLISCLPGDIPENIEVDVSELAIGDSVHVKNLIVEGVDILSDLEGLVATVSPPTVIKEEVEPEELEEEELEPELVGKEEGEEGAPEEKPSEEAEPGKGE
jgi:large subunit ribosomal protein L25